MKYETAIENMEREFWEKVAAASSADPDVNAASAAAFADALLEEWRKRFLKKPQKAAAAAPQSENTPPGTDPAAVRTTA